MSVTWTDHAAGQLQAVHGYLARTSPACAAALADRVIAATEALDGRPLSGAEVPEYGDPDVREVFVHPYRVLYRVAGSDVQVIAVVHSARRLPHHPPG